MTYRDPGWRGVMKYFPLMILTVPFLVLLPIALFFGWRIAGKDADGITRLRWLYVHLLVPFFGFLIVLFLITREMAKGESQLQWFPWVVAAVGVYELSGLFWLRSDRWLRSKRIAPLTPRSAVGGYIGVFFIGVALAYTPALVGFVGVFVTGDLSMYLLGLVFAIPAFLLIAPTQSDIERRQRQLDERGARFSLGEALMTQRDWRER
ncbi:MAG: hypothetical protein M3N24_10660 [Actinomycetota bacterium]|nr:hypothetical protein [Actinomycetota bacterium]